MVMKLKWEELQLSQIYLYGVVAVTRQLQALRIQWLAPTKDVKENVYLSVQKQLKKSAMGKSKLGTGKVQPATQTATYIIGLLLTAP
jgi:hypothetical protein